MDDLISLHIDESSRVNQSQIPRRLEAYAHQANTCFGHESSFHSTEWSFLVLQPVHANRGAPEWLCSCLIPCLQKKKKNPHLAEQLCNCLHVSAGIKQGGTRLS